MQEMQTTPETIMTRTTDSVTERNAEHSSEPPAIPEVNPSNRELQNTATSTPLPPRGRTKGPSCVSAKAGKLASPGVSGLGLPADPPSTPKSTTVSPESAVTTPPDSRAPISAPAGVFADAEQCTDLSKDHAKRGLPSSSKWDNTQDISKNPK